MTDQANWSELPLGKRPAGRWALRARFVVADLPEGRHLIEDGEVVIENDRVLWVVEASRARSPPVTTWARH